MAAFVGGVIPDHRKPLLRPFGLEVRVSSVKSSLSVVGDSLSTLRRAQVLPRQRPPLSCYLAQSIDTLNVLPNVSPSVPPSFLTTLELRLYSDNVMYFVLL